MAQKRESRCSMPKPTRWERSGISRLTSITIRRWLRRLHVKSTRAIQRLGATLSLALWVLLLVFAWLMVRRIFGLLLQHMTRGSPGVVPPADETSDRRGGGRSRKGGDGARAEAGRG